MKTAAPLYRSLFLIALLVIICLWAWWTFFAAKDAVVEPPRNALYLDPMQPIEARVADLLSYMTLEEKIGQMALVEKNSLQDLRDVSSYHLGALLSGSGSKPSANTVEGWREMIGAYQNAARSSRLKIPLLYGSDAIHGHAHVSGATVFPHAIGLGATRNPELVEQIARITKVELLAAGVNWNFAPNLDQPHDMRWGRMYEAFSDDPALVSVLGTAYVRGLQEGTSTISALATLKHFIGLGDMKWGTSQNKNFKIDQGVTPSDTDLLYASYLPPFESALNAGALSVMVGLNSWGSEKMVRNKELLTNLLKEDMDFKGFVVSDWYGVHEGRKDIFWATVSSVNAGVDMLMLPFDYKTFVWHMRLAHALGLISDERINDAVGRILYAKFSLGLFDDKQPVLNELTTVGSEEHRAVAREAVAQSMVLLKNDSVLPLRPSVKHIRVAGSAADNIGMQMGAWTMEWQGIDGNWLPEATSILQGIKDQAGADAVVEYDLSGTFDDEVVADVGIAVVGEKPYAEGWGDSEYPVLSKEDVQAIENLSKLSKNVVVVIVSGRPLLIEHEIDTFDALVAAWLPGSQGEGVADVLFGRKPFTGKLPVPWPRRLEQLPLGQNGETADNTEVLFPRAFGLE